MQKKILSLVLTIIIILSSTSLAFASTTTATDPARQKSTFAKDTVITEDNMNDILKYYGLDPSNVIKLNKPVTRDVTVQDLEKALKEFDKLPKTITIHDDNPTNVKVTNNITTKAVTGTATITKDNNITTSLVVRYFDTGKFYKNGSTKYWTDALGTDLKIVSDPTATYFYLIDKISKLTNTIYKASTSKSYLQMDYKYDVGCYLGVNGYGIKYKSITINGYSRFDNSYIP